MRGYSILYFFGQSLKGLWRNRLMTLASVTILLSSLVLIGSFAGLVYNLNLNINEVGMLNEIVVILDNDYSTEDETDTDTAEADTAEGADTEVSETDEDILAKQEAQRQINIENVTNAIRALDNISEIEFVSKEEGLASEKTRYEEYGYLFDEIVSAANNPLPDVFKIKYQNNVGVSNLVYELKQIPHVAKVQNRIDIANDIQSIKNGVSFVFIWFLALLFIVSIFIIINTIKIGVEMRSREISAMRYIGATDFFISTPFVIEGVFIGLLSAVVAYIIENLLYTYIYDSIGTNYQLIKVVPFDDLRFYTIVGFIVIGVFAGVVGSIISLRKYVKA